LEVDRVREFAKLTVKRQLTRGKRFLQTEEEFSARKSRTNVAKRAAMRGPAWTPEEESKGFHDDKVRS
jgi:hypothetical protein